MAKTDVQVQTKQQTDEAREKWLVPLARISEAEDRKILIQVEMPGVSKSKLQIEVENSELRITGTREAGRVDGTYLVRECRDGSFYRAFTLDDTIDAEGIEASMTAGVLTVTLHRKEAAKPRKIDVKVG